MSVEFFRFVRGAETWRFSTLAESVVADGHTWLPAPIQRSSIDVSSELEKSTVSLSVARDFPPALVYTYTSPRAATYVTIYRADLADIAATWGAVWHGQIAGVQWQGSFADVRCDPVLALLRRTSPKQRYSSSCRWTLYDSGCGVNRNAANMFRTGEIIDTDGPRRVRIATYEIANDPENWARGGTLQVTGFEAQLVTYSEATVIVGAVRERWVELARDLDGSGVLEPIRLQRGCGHTFADCTDLGNTPRYGGFHLLPTRLAP